MMTSDSIYLDNNATTPLAPEVVSAIRDACQESWGNPSSGYKRGRDAKAQVEDARQKITKMFGLSGLEDVCQDVITFTSGGTEVRSYL